MCGNTKLLLMVVLATLTFIEGRRKDDRKGKFISFHSDDDDAMSVELDFTIPFIKIPIRKTMDTVFGEEGLSFPTINVNLAALAIASVVIVGTVVVVPTLLKTSAGLHPYSPYARMIDNSEFGAETVLNFANNLMLDHQSVQGCAMRVACWAARSGYEVHELLDKLMRNHILYSMINSTAVEEAISKGVQGHQCLSYGPCTLTEDQVPILISSIKAFGK